MRDQWYADHRDLVKWATLLHVAQTHSIGTIVQVACYRPDAFNKHKLSVDGNQVDIPDAVWAHFRNIHAIQGLAQCAGITIRVLDDIYCRPRQSYYDNIIEHLTQPRNDSWVVFLDPDTGIEPEKTVDLKHVTCDEVAMVFDGMCPRDMLVFYQHARHTTTWLNDTKVQLASAIKREDGIQTYTGPKKLAGDVAFFVVKK